MGGDSLGHPQNVHTVPVIYVRVLSEVQGTLMVVTSGRKGTMADQLPIVFPAQGKIHVADTNSAVGLAKVADCNPLLIRMPLFTKFCILSGYLV